MRPFRRSDVRVRSLIPLSVALLALIASGCGGSEVVVVSENTCTAIPSGLISLWDGGKTVDSTAVDLITGTRNGTMSSQVGTAFGPSSSDLSSLSETKAFSMGSYSSTITVPNDVGFALTNQISVAGWVYSSNYQLKAGESLFSKGHRTNGLASTISSFSGTSLGLPGSMIGTGNVFDGRYIYYFPCGATKKISRYDTFKSFTSLTSWMTMDLSSLTGNLCTGGFFDGRYVNFNGYTTVNLLLRYDTTLDFSSISSYVSAAIPFSGMMVSDGRYYYTNNSPMGLMRFDPSNPAGITSPSSWTYNLQGSATIPYNIGFDGRYVYLVANDQSSIFYRFDTTADFQSASGWSSFDSAPVSGTSGGFMTSQFDGRYLYFGSATKYLIRYDTQADFATASSWTILNATTIPALSGSVNHRMRGSGFDGKYIYYVPYSFDSKFLRYNTTLSFTDPNSWDTVPISGAGGNNTTGGSFDGRYFYTGMFRTASEPMYRIDTSSQMSFDLRINNSSRDGHNNASFLGPAFTINTGDGYFHATSPTPLISSAWHFLVGTYDGSNVKMYVDGVLKASAPATGSMLVTTDDLKIGSVDTSKASFNGLVKDVQIYDTALSASTIQTISSAPLCK